jgi:hypothetical protein
MIDFRFRNLDFGLRMLMDEGQFKERTKKLGLRVMLRKSKAGNPKPAVQNPKSKE